MARFSDGINPEALKRAGVDVPPPLERVTHRSIVNHLRGLGWTVWEMQLGSQGNGAVWCTAGIPDLYVFKGTQPPVWLEVKRQRLGRVSKAQAERHEELRRSGIPVHVVTSVSEACRALNI